MLLRLLKVLLIPLFILTLLELLVLMIPIQIASLIKYIITGCFFTDKEIGKFVDKFPIGNFTNWLYFKKRDKKNENR